LCRNDQCDNTSDCRPGGLCRRCYFNLAVRRRFVRIRPENHGGWGSMAVVADKIGRLPQRATTATPGSAEKIMVLTERASRHEALFHPDDLSFVGGRFPWTDDMVALERLAEACVAGAREQNRLDELMRKAAEADEEFFGFSS
jgi:hypothetical protein